MTDGLRVLSRSPRSHCWIPPRHGARLAPSPSHPFRSRIPGSAPRPGPRRSGALSGRRHGPVTRWEAPRGRPEQDGGGPNGSVWGQGRGRHGCGGGAGAGREGGVSGGVPGAGGSLTWGRRRLGAPGVSSGAGDCAPGKQKKRTQTARGSRTPLPAPPRGGAGEEGCGVAWGRAWKGWAGGGAQRDAGAWRRSAPCPQ